MNRLIKNSVAILALAGTCAGVVAQDAYPTKPVRLVVGAPGGVQDILARVLAPELQKSLGQVIVVEPRAGAAGAIAAEAVVRAPADGHTLLVAVGAITILPALNKKLSFDVVKDFTAVSLVASAPNMLVVRSDSPVKDLKSFLAEARAKPGEVTYASSGIGSTVHIGGELLASLAGIKLNHIPYNGSGPSVEGLLGGQVMSSVSAVNATLPHIKSGRLRALAVASETRTVFLPDVPTFEELGVKGMRSETWLGILGPANLPKSIAARLNNDLVQVIGRPETRERILAMGAEPVGLPLEKFATLIKSEVELFERIVRNAGIKPE